MILDIKVVFMGLLFLGGREDNSSNNNNTNKKKNKNDSVYVPPSKKQQSSSHKFLEVKSLNLIFHKFVLYIGVYLYLNIQNLSRTEIFLHPILLIHHLTNHHLEIASLIEKLIESMISSIFDM